MPQDMSSVKRRSGANSDSQENGSVQTSNAARQSRYMSRDESLSDRPCHKSQDSLFSSSSGYTNYRGFFNLCLILLTLSNLRVALENIIKYGILIDPTEVANVFSTAPHKSPIVWLLALLNVFICISLFIEKWMVTGKLSDKDGAIFYIIHLAAVLFVPAMVILLV